MKKVLLILLGTVFLIVLILSFALLPKFAWPEEIPIDTSKEPKLTLLDPETAPSEIKPLVMQGYRLLLETRKYASQYVGAQINCTNCHFEAGNTEGGFGNGISLVGVTLNYPKVLPGNKFYTLEERINACFENSLNGKPLPILGQEMKAIMAYLEWISRPAKKFSSTPWLGLKLIDTNAPIDPQKGTHLYFQLCSSCHGNEGQGEKRKDGLSYPSVFGEKSFNHAAGMNRLPTLATFIYNNMPYEEPSLSEKEAFDIASFIIKQKRPIKNIKNEIN